MPVHIYVFALRHSSGDEKMVLAASFDMACKVAGWHVADVKMENQNSVEGMVIDRKKPDHYRKTYGPTESSLLAGGMR